MKFEYYVLNYNFNKKCVENFNIFSNMSLNNAVKKEVRKYLRSPKKYCYIQYGLLPVGTHGCIYGFDGLCEEIKSLIMWQEWGRREYEISVGDAFEDDMDKLEKWDCYMQCKPNIPIIAREVIWQYKQQLKEKENESI
jgi:hypothetical protein